MENNIFRSETEDKNAGAGLWLQRYNDFVDRFLGFSISTTLHLILLAFLSYLVFYTEKQESIYSKIGLTELEIPKLDLKLPEELPQVQGSSEQRDASFDEAVSEGGNNSASNDLHSERVPAQLLSSSFGSQSGSTFGDGFTSLGSTVLAGDISSGNAFYFRQKTARGKNSPDDKWANDMVRKALDYLKAVQNSDGSWGNTGNNDMDDAISSLALLSFLAFGEDTATPRYGITVQSGLQRLLERGKTNSSDRLDGFGEALLTYVLAEGASITQIPELIELTRQRIRQIQRKVVLQESSWKAGTLSTWNYQAMKAASFALSQDEFNEFTKQSALHLLQYHRNQCSSLEKQPRSADISEIFTRTHSLQLFGYGNHQTVKRYLSQSISFNRGAMLDCQWQEPQAWPLYNWYYRSNALYHESQGKSSAWDKWFKNLVKMLSTQQNPDGSFISPEMSAAYNQSGENLQTFKGEKNLAIYSTALCALMLQTQYRYLPAYFAAENTKKPPLIDPVVRKKIGTGIVMEKLDISY